MDALNRETKEARMASFEGTQAKEGRNMKLETNDGRSKIMTTELNDVLMFCFFYSGIVLYSLWITVAERHLRVEARARKLR
jgi:hypothetical protein